MALAGNLVTLEPTGELVVVGADTAAAEQEMNLWQSAMNQSGGAGEILVILIGVKAAEQPDQGSVAGDAELSANIGPGRRIGPKDRGVEPVVDHAACAACHNRLGRGFALPPGQRRPFERESSATTGHNIG